MKEDQNNIVVFLGPPGSGKGSLSKLCVSRLDWLQISTGNLCREHIANNTEIGKKIDLIIKSGKLIDDALINDMIQDLLNRKLQDPIWIILDGYPRTVNQAHFLTNSLFSERFKTVKLHLIRMKVSDETLTNRLLSRVICSDKKCQAVYSLSVDSLRPKVENVCDICSSELIKRQDDEESAIKERLKVYRMHEQKLLDFYKSIDQEIKELEIERDLEDIYSDFLSKVGISFA